MIVLHLSHQYRLILEIVNASLTCGIVALKMRNGQKCLTLVMLNFQINKFVLMKMKPLSQSDRRGIWLHLDCLLKWLHYSMKNIIYYAYCLVFVGSLYTLSKIVNICFKMAIFINKSISVEYSHSIINFVKIV